MHVAVVIVGGQQQEQDIMVVDAAEPLSTGSRSSRS